MNLIKRFLGTALCVTPFFSMAQYFVTLIADTAIWSVAARGDTILVGTGDGKVLRSVDAAQTWTNHSGNMPQNIITDVIPAANGWTYCSNGPGVWRTADLETWELIHSAGNGITHLLVSGDTVLCTAELTGGLWASYDAGDSWASLSDGLPYQYGTSIALQADTVFWSRFNAPVLMRPLTSSTWQEISGLPIDVFSLSPRGERAGTNSMLFRRSGTEWTADTTNFNTQILDIEVSGPDGWLGYTIAAAGASSGDDQALMLTANNALFPFMGMATPIEDQINQLAWSGPYLYLGGFGGLVRFYVPSIGIEEEARDHLVLFPNPSTGTVQCNSAVGGELRVHDRSGSLVFTRQLVNAGAYALNLSHLEPGCYFISLQREGGLLRRKLILMK